MTDRERDASEGVEVARTETQAMSEPKRHVSQETRQRQARARLSVKQTRFIREYIASGNGADAARRAGYAKVKPSIKSALALEMAATNSK